MTDDRSPDGGAVGVADEPVKHNALRRSAAQGVKWSFISVAGTNVGRLLFTFVLARLLGPENFGIVAQATIYTTFVVVLLDQGFGQALIQRRGVDRRDVATVGTINAGGACLLAAVTIVLAPAAADFFATEELTAVLRVLAVSVLMKGFVLAPKAMMRRDLEFRTLAMLDTTSMVLGGVAGIVAAFAGAEYWALVVQTLVTEAAVLIWVLRLRGWPRFGLALDRLGVLWSFSVSLMGAQLLNFTSQNADNLVIARALDPTQLAFYALSYRLLRLPIQLIASVVNGVALPVFSRLQDDLPRVRNWYLTASRSEALAAWPVFTLVIVGATEGVPFVFGERWRPAVVPLQILTVSGFLGIVRMLGGPMCTALGRPKIVLFWSAASVVPSVIGYVIGVRWGIVGVAVAYLSVNLAVGVPNLVHVGRLIDLGGARFVANFVAPFCGCLVLAATWLGVHWGLRAIEAHMFFALALPTAVGLATYVGLVRLVWPETFTASREIVGLMGRHRSGNDADD